MIQVELHVHSHYSFDCFSKPRKILTRARQLGYQAIAITDHNVFRVDWETLQQENPDILLIPGSEIGTTYGDVLAYFLKEEIHSKDFDTVVDEIHAQGGLAVLAHPFHRGFTYPDSVFEKVDGLEAYNPFNLEKQAAVIDIGRRLNKPLFAGSDAHFIKDMGKARNMVDISIEQAKNVDDFKAALLTKSTPECTQGSSWSPVWSQSIRMMKRIIKPLNKK